MSRTATLCSVVSLLFLAGCGGVHVKPTWHDEPMMSEPVEGLVLALDIGLDELPVGQSLDVKVGIRNSLLKSRILDLSGDWAKCRFVITGPDGVVEPEAYAVAESRPEFVKLGPGDHLMHSSQGPSSDRWGYEPLRQPGDYTIKAVYEVGISPEWNRLCVAGGPYEGQVLWIGKAETPEIEFSVYLPEGMEAPESSPAETVEKTVGESAENPTKNTEE